MAEPCEVDATYRLCCVPGQLPRARVRWEWCWADERICYPRDCGLSLVKPH